MTLVGHFKHQIMGMISNIAFQVIEYKNWDLKMLVSSFSFHNYILYNLYYTHNIIDSCCCACSDQNDEIEEAAEKEFSMRFSR